MSEPIRIGLRLLGLLMFLAGIAGVIALFQPGPTEIADWMGQSCDHDSRDLEGPEQCTAGDVVLILIGAPFMILVGGVMALALRPAGKDPFTLDLSRGRNR